MHMIHNNNNIKNRWVADKYGKRAVVYQIRMEDSHNKGFYKIGYSHNLSNRMLWIPSRFRVDILSALTLSSVKEVKALEKFIHANRKDSYTYIGRKWSGYKELYTEEISLKQWLYWFRNGFPEILNEEEDNELDNFLKL